MENLSDKQKEEHLTKQIQDLIDSDYTYEQIAKLLKIPIERVLGII